MSLGTITQKNASYSETSAIYKKEVSSIKVEKIPYLTLP